MKNIGNTRQGFLLERYISSIKAGRLKNKNFGAVSQKLIELTLADARSRERLHKRWHAEIAIGFECQILAAMVINRNDPIAKELREILKNHPGYDENTLQKKLEHVLQLRNNELSEIQSARGNIPKTPSPFKKLLNNIVQKTPEINFKELLEELNQDCHSHIIRDVDEDANKIYLENGEKKSFKAVQTTLNRIKKQKK